MKGERHYNPERRSNLEFRGKLQAIFQEFEKRHEEPKSIRPQPYRSHHDLEERVGELDELKSMILDSPDLEESEKDEALEIAERWYGEYKQRRVGVL